jgi:hypothetical protein
MRLDFLKLPPRPALLMAKRVADAMDGATWRSLAWRAMTGRVESAKAQAELALACTIVLRQQTPGLLAITAALAAGQWIVYAIISGPFTLAWAVFLSLMVVARTAAGCLVVLAERRNRETLFGSVTIPLEALPLEAWRACWSSSGHRNPTAEKDIGLQVQLILLGAIAALRFGGAFFIVCGMVIAYCAVMIVRIGVARRELGGPFWRSPRRQADH